MSLRLKIAILLAALAAAATTAIGVASYRSTAHEWEETIDRSLQDAARRFTDLPGGDNGFDFDQDGDGRPGGSGRPPSFEQILWQYIDAGGTVLGTSNYTTLPVADSDLAVAAGTASNAQHELDLDGETYRVLTVRYRNGAVILARSLKESESATSKVLHSTLVSVGVVTATALLLGWLLAWQVTRRLERLTTVAGTVASTGRLDVEVPVEGRDETGQLGRAFSGMLSALQRSRQEQQQLVQDAGHELRTPLTSLRTNVAVLRRGHDKLDGAARDQLLADLDSETRELTDLVNELVELAVLGDRRDDEPVQPVRLADVAERAAARARRRFGRDVTVTGDDTLVEGRPNALERAVQNLVDNACKFSEGGTVEVTVRAGELRVRDHGPGLRPDDIPHLFDRFYRSVEMRSKPGSGLGLSIVKSVVDAHDGEVLAGNAPGGGAEIGFRLTPA